MGYRTVIATVSLPELTWAMRFPQGSMWTAFMGYSAQNKMKPTKQKEN